MIPKPPTVFDKIMLEENGMRTTDNERIVSIRSWR
jgi:hypothetical protein